MPASIMQIGACEVCGNTHLIKVLDLGSHPMCDDLIRIGDPRVSLEYPIEILFCENCLTAHQRFQIPKQELFPTNYHYRARFTADVLEGMAGLVDICEERFGDLAGKTVLDIGCNDGSLLDFFKKKGAITLGVEPTDAQKDATSKGHKTFNAFFDTNIADEVLTTYGQPDFIIFTNVFAHIENLQELILALRVLIAVDTVIVIENHYLGAVLDGSQFDTFYHEHPRTYSCNSFVYIARSLGVDILSVEFPRRYGGNVRVFMGSRKNASIANDISDVVNNERVFPAKFEILAQRVDQWRQNKKESINQLIAQHGKLRAKAFPGRAAILVKLLGLTEESISAVYEKPGSLKIGHYVPGTRIPIISDDILFEEESHDQPLLNLAWHISDEIRHYLADRGYDGPIIDIVDKSDFGVE